MTGQISQRALLEAAVEGLRMLAADARCRAAFAVPGSVLHELLSPAARRYVLAPDRAGFAGRIEVLRARGYRVTAEFAAPGQEDADPARIERNVGEYLALLAQVPSPDRLGLDLVQVGLALSQDLAARNTGRIAAAAAARGSEVVLGLEHSAGADAVLSVHRELAGRYDNVGVTLQAHLHRCERDAVQVAGPGRTVRLVREALPEPADTALLPGPALDDRFLSLAHLLVDRGARLSLATQDPVVLAEARDRGLLGRVTDIEMPYGVRPELLRSYREAGLVCRIRATYGTNWWMLLMQRLAEHPPMMLHALADIGREHRAAGESGY